MWVVREIVRHLRQPDPVDEYCRETHGFERPQETKTKTSWRQRLAIFFSLMS